jgi:hypothetical protein
MALIALVLMQVNSNLKKLSDDTKVSFVLTRSFYKNKVYIALFSIVLFIVGGYYTASALIDFGRQKHYEPVQPIFYSHKVHAGYQPDKLFVLSWCSYGEQTCSNSIG